MEKFTQQELIELVTSALERAGVPEKNSKIIADVTVMAQMRGVTSHGVQMIPVYLERIRHGGIDPKAEPAAETRGQGLWLVDGNGSFGQLTAHLAAELIEKALKNGELCVVGVRNANHCGMLAYYTQMLARAGGVGFMTSNTNPNTAAFGGAEKVLGTNPFSIAFPTAGEPITIDMATTALAKGKLYEYAEKGVSIPEGVAVDREGYPVTDPKQALSGILLPFAGYKGYAISLAVELLSGVLTGAGYSKQVHSLHQDMDKQQNVGMLLAGIPVCAFMTREEYNARVSDLEAIIKDGKKAAGVERIYFPGELEAQKLAKNRTGTMELDDKLVQALQ